MEFQLSTLIATLINFAIIILVLKHFFWDKIQNVLQEREDLIEGTIAKADEDAEKARRLRIENETILKSAKEEGKKITEAKKKKADAVYNEIVDDAHKEAETIMERAKLEIAREKQKAEYELKTQAVDLAVLLSGKALEQSIDEENHRRLINDFIDKVGV
ncbi:ATP synthase F0 subcomplex B subunit [Clostridium cavendishii DSM 21758]|uniref:ATP synthase subunit b n=1 Tax=Clostridium cavendishii DSM 21758 TaxID=1121302 RepID=A0A1M6U3L2_9CLOT|nr:F0F1 ATP synthase subunit B [Clostridium cavendishii]SHK63875.1 ATP synthase F0 subcomplex B subunit [Clostridium cavendishii DSM 21758]